MYIPAALIFMGMVVVENAIVVMNGKGAIRRKDAKKVRKLFFMI